MIDPAFKITIDNEVVFAFFALIAVIVICKTVVTVMKNRK